MVSRTVSWINTPVLLEAMERYEQGRLSRPLALWLETVLELDPPATTRLTPGC